MAEQQPLVADTRPHFPLYLDWRCGCREQLGWVQIDPGELAVFRSKQICPRDCASCLSAGATCAMRVAARDLLEYEPIPRTEAKGLSTSKRVMKKTGSLEWEKDDDEYNPIDTI